MTEFSSLEKSSGIPSNNFSSIN